MKSTIALCVLFALSHADDDQTTASHGGSRHGRSTWSTGGDSHSGYKPDYYKTYKPKRGKCPPGVIQGFFGELKDIPDGFVLCDGSKGTPDLQDRFLLGAGRKADLLEEGGRDALVLEEEQLPSHAHGAGHLATEDEGLHTHSFDAVTHDGGHIHKVINLEVDPAGLHKHQIDVKTEKAGKHKHFFDAYFPIDYDTYHAEFEVPLTKVDLDKSYSIDVSKDGEHVHAVHGFTEQAGEHTHPISGTVGADDDGQHFHNINGVTDPAGDHNHPVVGETAPVGNGDPVPILPPFTAIYWICCPIKKDPKPDWYH